MQINPRSGFIDPDAFQVEVDALRSLLRGEVRSHLTKPSVGMTEIEWMNCGNPKLMLQWLEKQGRLDERRIRLFGCACARRVWGWLTKLHQNAIMTVERFVDGFASAAEFEETRIAVSKLCAVPDGRAEDAVTLALYGSWWSGCQSIWCHFDDPELVQEKNAQAELVRHIFGNPFRSLMQPHIDHNNVRRLAARVYEGEPYAKELHEALLDANQEDLAEHFARPDHPRGCWALDVILGK